MIRETSDHLDSKASHHSDSVAHLSVSAEDMQAFFKSEKTHPSAAAAAHNSQFLDMGSADSLYGKGAHSNEAVHHVSDQQFDLGKAVQDWAGSIIDAGKHMLEGVGKEAPKSEPIEDAPHDDIKPFNPQIDWKSGKAWSINDFEKWLKKNENNPDIFYPEAQKTPDIDPGFDLPMTKKGGPDIDPGIKLPEDRTFRKVITEKDKGELDAIFAEAH